MESPRRKSLRIERDFLLASIDDLDAELAADDIAEADHAAISDSYTRRAAQVMRELEGLDSGSESNDRLEPRQTSPVMLRRVMTVAGVVLVALVAGVLLARSSGFRTPTDTVTGDIRRSSAGLLAEADTLTREGRWSEAVEVYDEVLDIAPANVEALTYRGWITAQTGDAEAGAVSIDEAIAVDPDYPDARVFAAILANNNQEFDVAAGHLQALDNLDRPDQVDALIEAAALRPSVAAGQIAQRFGGGEPIDLGQVDASTDDVARAALILDQVDPVLSFKVFDAVLATDPENLVALMGKGRRLGTDADIRQQSPAVADEGLRLLDRAVELRPGNAEARLYRALALAVAGDKSGAADDLSTLDPAALPEELVQLYDLIAESVT